MIAAPGLYAGTIRHRRFAPRPHAFQYTLFMALLDIDHLREAMAVSRFTSYNRWNWAAFDERDHIGDPRRPLRERLAENAAAAGEVLPDGQIQVLTHLRYAGYVFNPISLFYCHDRAGDLQLVLADVRNTYGGRRSYWLRSSGGATPRFRAVAAKSLYVSPFMEGDVDYEFLLTPPGKGLVVHMNVTRPGVATREEQASRLFDATLTLQHTPWTAQAVRGALVRFPLMTAKVIAAIYWEAYRLRFKGLPEMPLPEESR